MDARRLKSQHSPSQDRDVEGESPQAPWALPAGMRQHYGLDGGGSPLPGGVQSKMEKSFGADFSDVRVQQSDEPARLGAHAFTRGTQIHFAPGRYHPESREGQSLLGHELTHVVQQKAGLVAPQTMAKSVSLNNDPALEAEADTLGARAARGETVSVAAAGGGVQRKDAGTVIQCGNGSSEDKSKSRESEETKDEEEKDDLPPKPLSRKHDISSFEVKTMGGGWNIRNKEEYERAHTEMLTSKEFGVNDKVLTECGVKIALVFIPIDPVNATKIGLCQTVKCVVNGQPFDIDGRKMTDEGLRIDRLRNSQDPMYVAMEGINEQSHKSYKKTKQPVSRSKQETGEGGADPYWGSYGHCTPEEGCEPATLIDEPYCKSITINSCQIFETVALALDGPDKGTYYGSVQWGWRTDEKGVFTILPLTVISIGVPSPSFMKAAKLWNQGSHCIPQRALPLPLSERRSLGKDLPKGQALRERILQVKEELLNNPDDKDARFELKYLEDALLWDLPMNFEEYAKKHQ